MWQWRLAHDPEKHALDVIGGVSGFGRDHAQSKKR
jgi:hypothetical protein